MALGAAVLNLLRPSIVLCAVAARRRGFGIVLYNAALSALAVALLILSLARPAPAAELNATRQQAAREPQRLPVGERLVPDDEDRAQHEHRGRHRFGQRRGPAATAQRRAQRAANGSAAAVSGANGKSR